MTNVINLQEIIPKRREQPSYHLASDDHLRVQIFNLAKSEELGTWKVDGNALITVISGAVTILTNGATEQASEMCQFVVPPKSTFRLVAEDGPATFEIVWCPPFAKVETVNEQK